MEIGLVRLDDKGRVVIPKRVRERVGISVADVLFVYTFEGLIFLRKATPDKAAVLETIRRLGE